MGGVRGVLNLINTRSNNGMVESKKIIDTMIVLHTIKTLAGLK